MATFAYDDGGRRTTRTLGDTPGTQTTWSYGRQDNLPTAIADNRGVASFGYTYDANKNKLTETIGGVMSGYGFNSTTYDAGDRLTAWQRADSNLHQSWTLSHVGDWNTFTENQSQQTRTHDPVHQLTAIDQASLTHDAKGNLTTDSNGQTYSWDFDNHLTSATVGADTHGYTYDALGRRISKTVRDGENAVTTVFVSMTDANANSPNAGQEVAEYLANAAATDPLRKYVYSGAYVDEPVLLVDRTAAGSVGAGTDEIFYYHQNNLYSAAALTDQSGSVVERYAYSAYGEVTFCDPSTGAALSPQPAASALGNPYLYTARRLDGESSLFYYRARMYSPRLGRFISRDPISYKGGFNLHEYVGDHPTNTTDPDGCVELQETIKGRTRGVTVRSRYGTMSSTLPGDDITATITFSAFGNCSSTGQLSGAGVGNASGRLDGWITYILPDPNSANNVFVKEEHKFTYNIIPKSLTSNQADIDIQVIWDDVTYFGINIQPFSIFAISLGKWYAVDHYNIGNATIHVTIKCSDCGELVIEEKQ